LLYGAVAVVLFTKHFMFCWPRKKSLAGYRGLQSRYIISPAYNLDTFLKAAIPVGSANGFSNTFMF